MKKESDYSSNAEELQTCFLCSYPPRECGIATFSKDLSSAMDQRFNPKLKSKVIALNEEEKNYEYENKVVFQINRDDIENYIHIAKRINESPDIKIVCIQHEFGLFGGDYGAYVIPFLEIINKPKVVVFHTVLPNPDEYRKKIVNAIASRCSAMIVIANAAIDILENDYGIEREKIYMVHHGIPNVPFQENREYKEKLGLKDRIVLSSHGLLSRGKGIHYAIKALPYLVKKYANITYLIIGETHPGAEKRHGEDYRNELENLVEELDLKEHVKFINRYVPLNELLEYFLASDVYLFTNLEKEQISSGALVRPFGCGRAVVSTPIVYSKELLADNRGIIVGLKDPKSFAMGVDLLLSNPELKKEIEKNAYFYSRQMIWSNVALSYLKIFNKIIQLRKEITEKLPEIKLDHLKRMTDDFGIIQFAEHTTPDIRSGYTLDDNCRALIVSVLHNYFFKNHDSINLTNKYLNFIKNAQDENGNIKNQHKNEEETKDPYSEDAFGRAIWALGFTINKIDEQDIKEKAKIIFDKSLNRISKLDSPRAIAFTITGLVHYYKSVPDRNILFEIKRLSNKLVEHYYENSSGDWKWFEAYLTYANAQIPRSLFLAYNVTHKKEYLKVAEESLNFLSNICIINEKLFPIGQNGWYNRGNRRMFFDQQPVDTSAFVQAYLAAYENTMNIDYYNKAIVSFNWFLGNNHLSQMIYDEATGGCFDGLGQHSLNFNQGAESTVCYLLARLSLQEFIQKK